MSEKNRQNTEESKQEAKLEDLPVEEIKQEEVKGGAGAVFLVDIAARK